MIGGFYGITVGNGVSASFLKSSPVQPVPPKKGGLPPRCSYPNFIPQPPLKTFSYELKHLEVCFSSTDTHHHSIATSCSNVPTLCRGGEPNPARGNHLTVPDHKDSLVVRSPWQSKGPITTSVQGYPRWKRSDVYCFSFNNHFHVEWNLDKFFPIIIPKFVCCQSVSPSVKLLLA